MILSTHILPEVEAICQRVIIMHRGKKALDAPLAELQRGGASLDEIFARTTAREVAVPADVAAGGAAVKHVGAIAGRELNSLFVSPVAYAVLTLFAVLAGFFFLSGVLQFHEYVIRLQPFQAIEQLEELNLNDHLIAPFLHVMSVVLLFLVPGVTMGLFASEKTNGTHELLLTSPITIWELVIGKFLAAAAFVAILVLLLAALPGDPLHLRRSRVRQDRGRIARAAAGRHGLRVDRRLRVLGDAQPVGRVLARLRAAAGALDARLPGRSRRRGWRDVERRRRRPAPLALDRGALREHGEGSRRHQGPRLLRGDRGGFLMLTKAAVESVRWR